MAIGRATYNGPCTAAKLFHDKRVYVRLVARATSVASANRGVILARPVRPRVARIDE